MMPSYDRIEEMDRWDVVNYVRALQQPTVAVPVTPAGQPGETGRTVPGYTRTGPTIPSPYLRPDGRVNLAPMGVGAGAAPADSTAGTAAPASAPPNAPPANPTTPAPATQPETHQ
ncbi:MAG TPA: hypothetical protein VHM30_00400 [Gemmatimonadaceae bacterium]|nr:hypothetical protein [Gemmatimonadaceae bacterium]